MLVLDIYYRLGFCEGKIWTEVQVQDALFDKKELLGNVHIRFKNMPIKIENGIIGPFQSYDDFWEYISK